MVQSLPGLRNILMKITYLHMPKQFQVSVEKHPNKHILVLRNEKHNSSVLSYDKGY